jgi:hypothetical protein
VIASRRLRAAALPVVAAALVGGLLGIQAAAGGADFAPRRAADPCVVRPVTSVSDGIDGLAERLVLIAIQDAACRLGVTRETLVLDLAQSRSPSDAQVSALRAGLLDAVDRLQAAGQLPPASGLANEAVDRSNLNGFAKFAIKALPDSLIDKALKTDDVLRRTVRGLDLRKVLGDLDNPDDLQRQLDAAVTQAVRDALIAFLRDLI